MKRRVAVVACTAAVLLIAGCASGPKYSEMSKTIPALKAGEGRIIFFRSSSMMGAAIQPEIRLNGTVVGTSQPGGFFYVDRPAGSYSVASASEVEKTLSLTLAAGETKYVRSSVSFGVAVGRIQLQLEDPKVAQAELDSLSYTPLTAAPATK